MLAMTASSTWAVQMFEVARSRRAGVRQEQRIRTLAVAGLGRAREQLVRWPDHDLDVERLGAGPDDADRLGMGVRVDQDEVAVGDAGDAVAEGHRLRGRCA